MSRCLACTDDSDGSTSFGMDNSQEMPYLRATERQQPLLADRAEWSGSEKVYASASENTDAASSNDTPCLRRLVAALCFMEQEMHEHLQPDAVQKENLNVMLNDMETLLARMG